MHFCHTMKNKQNIVLVGAGIMSATLGVLLKKLMPEAHITILERLDRLAAESSDALNNAGTGHSAFCELNYTPEKTDGSIDIAKAVKIASAFEVSKEFWSYLLEYRHIDNAPSFIRRVPHLSVVWGEASVDFLKNRYAAMRLHPLFEEMEYTEDRQRLTEWMPLVMEGRATDEPVAATRMAVGTDINFGNLSRALFHWLSRQEGVTILLDTEVRDVCRQTNGNWALETRQLKTDEKGLLTADFVFLGAGGGALPLLEKSNIEEAEGYGGFPISGQWLICHNPEVIKRHAAKVYGKAAIGAPPMSVPHLDTRWIDGQQALLFGPFAGFSTKFLKNGSYWDLPASIEWANMFPMLAAGWQNLPLTKYLIQQISQSQEDRLEALRAYYPQARAEDWELAIAGQRVQVIKKDAKKIGVLEFGTELVCAADGSLAALLGASPGASTAVTAMLDVLKQCFPEEMKSAVWKGILKNMVPSYGAPFTKLNRLEYSRQVVQAALNRELGL